LRLRSRGLKVRYPCNKSPDWDTVTGNAHGLGKDLSWRAFLGIHSHRLGSRLLNDQATAL